MRQREKLPKEPSKVSKWRKCEIEKGDEEKKKKSSADAFIFMSF